MSSASYIPLAQVPAPEPFWEQTDPPSRLALCRAYFSRRRAVSILVFATSLFTLAAFVRFSLSNDEVVKLELSLDSPEESDVASYQPKYIAVPLPDSLPPEAQPKLRPVRELPITCLEQYYTAGQLCHDGRGALPFDIVWTWVNGSDPLFADEKEAMAQSYSADDPYRPRKSNNPSRMFRYVVRFLSIPNAVANTSRKRSR